MSNSIVEIEEGPELPWERKFLKVFLTETYATVAKAADQVGISADEVASRERESPRFRQNLATCREILKDTVRYEILRRALEPTETPIIHRGVIVAVKQEWDNRHLQWVAERLMPEEFHLPTRIEAAGSGSGDVHFRLELNPGQKKEDDD